MKRRAHKETHDETGTTKLAALHREYESRFESRNETKEFLSLKELLEKIPVSRKTIHNWRRSRKIPAIVIGRRVLFCWKNVSDALRKMEIGGLDQ
jgi:predicted DNA-binding transcriptional regulator AlpA